MAGVPYVFGNATTSIPLTNLDANFNTGLTIGNTTVGLGNTVTTLGNVTIANATTISAAGNVFLATSSGNVGIGTASPSTKFQVSGTTDTPVYVYTSNANNFLQLSNASNNFYLGAVSANCTFTVNGSERMRIDSSGNVGIGTSSPASKLNVNGSTNTNSGIYLQNQTTSIGIFSNEATWLGTGSSNNLAISSYGSNAFLFGTAGAERMRIDSSGNLLKGTTSVYSTAYGTGDISFYSANAGFVTLAPGAAGGGVPTIQIYLNAAGTAVGYIAVSTAATFFTSLSDYRVKKDIITMQGGLEKINKLKPVTYKLKADDSDGEGFIAHELQEIIPFAVIGKKDDVADNGEIKPQAIDQSKIVATLVLAVQELSAEVQSLKQQLGK